MTRGSGLLSAAPGARVLVAATATHRHAPGTEPTHCRARGHDPPVVGDAARPEFSPTRSTSSRPVRSARRRTASSPFSGRRCSSPSSFSFVRSSRRRRAAIADRLVRSRGGPERHAGRRCSCTAVSRSRSRCAPCSSGRRSTTACSSATALSSLALAVGTIAYGAAYVLRGACGGLRWFQGYGAGLVADGVVRIAVLVPVVFVGHGQRRRGGGCRRRARRGPRPAGPRTQAAAALGATWARARRSTCARPPRSLRPPLQSPPPTSSSSTEDRSS